MSEEPRYTPEHLHVLAAELVQVLGENAKDLRSLICNEGTVEVSSIKNGRQRENSALFLGGEHLFAPVRALPDGPQLAAHDDIQSMSYVVLGKEDLVRFKMPDQRAAGQVF
jgi:hypothetical protein